MGFARKLSDSNLELLPGELTITLRPCLPEPSADRIIGYPSPTTTYESPVANRPNLHPTPVKTTQVHHNALIPVFAHVTDVKM